MESAKSESVKLTWNLVNGVPRSPIIASTSRVSSDSRRSDTLDGACRKLQPTASGVFWRMLHMCTTHLLARLRPCLGGTRNERLTDIETRAYRGGFGNSGAEVV